MFGHASLSALPFSTLVVSSAAATFLSAWVFGCQYVSQGASNAS